MEQYVFNKIKLKEEKCLFAFAFSDDDAVVICSSMFICSCARFG